MKANNKLIVNGPRKIPIGPKSAIPPNTERSTSNGCNCRFFPRSFGPNKLSISPTASIPQIKSPIAEMIFPITKRYIIPGTITRAVPNPGIRAAITVIVPQRTLLGIPKIVKPIAVKIP